MKIKNILIRCKGNRYLPHTKLKTFQGNLKEMSKKNSLKLRAQIIKHGWIVPIFVWKNGKNEEILDGHGRLLVLEDMIKEGYTIDDLPIVDIMAKTKKEAGEILLSINSHYQVITADGFDNFINEMKLSLKDLDNIVLPDINIDALIKELEKEENQIHPPDNILTNFEVIIECNSEKETKDTFEKIKAEGYKCRILIF